MGYTLGAKSRAELIGVEPRLVAAVQRAIEITQQDFTVHDGLRTEAEQREYVKRGVSQTMNSLHRPQADGYGHAVDLVPWINGKPRWEWEPIYEIAAAMKQAAREKGVDIRWGGGWVELSQIKGDAPLDIEKAQQAYVSARLRAGKRAFPDGPHFELAR
jgi:peptidoglycan L-alanyl-D-glutamate endopeptidase CwlK